MANHLFGAEKIARAKVAATMAAHAKSSSYPSNTFYNSTYHAVVTAETLDPEAFKAGAPYCGVNAWDHRGLRPIHYLARRSDTRVEYLEDLVSKGADPLARTNIKRMCDGSICLGDTPYESSRQYGGFSPPEGSLFENQWSSNRGVVEYLFAYELEMRLGALKIQKLTEEYKRKTVSDYYPKDTEETEK